MRALREDRRGWVAGGHAALEAAAARSAPSAASAPSSSPRGAAAARAARDGRRLMAWASQADGHARRGPGRGRVPALARPRRRPRAAAVARARRPRHLLRPDRARAGWSGCWPRPSPPWQRDRAERLLAPADRGAALQVQPRRRPAAACPRGGASSCPGRWRTTPRSGSAPGRCGPTATSSRAARAANPGAVILWKPHPDVEAGLRPGAVPDADRLRRRDARPAWTPSRPSRRPTRSGP